MKKILYITSFLLFSTLIFTGCEKDSKTEPEVNYEELIIGTWDAQTINGLNINAIYEYFTVSFKADKTGEMIYKEVGVAEESFPYVWSISDKVISLDGAPFYTIKSMSAASATFEYEDDVYGTTVWVYSKR
jgi:hypothetical protein